MFEGNDDAERMTTLEDIRKNAKKNGSVISPNMLPFEDIQDIVDPLLHIYMGLVNDNLHHMKKECKSLDQTVHTEMTDKIEKVIAKLEDKARLLQNQANEMYDCIDLLKLISIKRLPDILNDEVYEAERKADKLYKVGNNSVLM